MTRIIAGVARGRVLKVPDKGTRPTSDRVKESVFSALEHTLGGFHGLRVADLYAGSGALGLEAASRGAEQVVLVERAAPAVRVIKENIAAAGLAGVSLAAVDVAAWARSAAHPGQGWDIVFADPPYDLADSEIAAVLADLVANHHLAPDCQVIVERGKPRAGASEGFPWPPDFTAVESRVYGDTVVHRATIRGGTSGI